MQHSERFISLAATQTGFADALLAPDSAIPKDIAVSSRGSGRRFGVYRNNVMVGLVEALMAAYPAVARIVGGDFFRAVGQEFVRLSPPRSPVMLDYGAGFADFLDRFEPVAGLPYLGDVARLERAWLEAYHAADCEACGIEALSGIAPDQLPAIRFMLHPALRLVRSQFPVGEIWRTNLQDETVGPIDFSKAEAVIVTRPELEVAVRVLPAGGAAFIAALIEGKTLAEAAGAGFGSNAEFDLSENLQGLFVAGAVRSVRIAGGCKEKEGQTS
ncbi:MAG: putative DNA-binding domain-containing protein [Hyphomicrobiales bacterium]|nr:putative DNA-binding domain-containing protein [Hyphomicrobiales bacterium]